MDTILDNLTPEKATDAQVIAQAVKAAKSFSQIWNDQGKWLVELKARFQVRQGSRGKQLPVEGKKLYWDEFCDEYLSTTARGGDSQPMDGSQHRVMLCSLSNPAASYRLRRTCFFLVCSGG